jgi:hypothetical protein
MKAIWTIDVPEVAPLRVREGSKLCRVGAPKRELQVQSLKRKDANTVRVELLVLCAKRAYREQDGRAYLAADSTSHEGEEMTLVPVSMDQLSRRKNEKIWGAGVPGAWITHAKPAGPKARLPQEANGEDDNLFEQLARL